MVDPDLPGVNAGTIDIDVERNVLTVRAGRAKPRKISIASAPSAPQALDTSGIEQHVGAA